MRTWLKIMSPVRSVVAVYLLVTSGVHVMAQSVFPEARFSSEQSISGWVTAHDLDPISVHNNSMVLSITGADPYCISPEQDYPEGVPLWIEITIFSESGGTGQLFYFTDGHGPLEQNSVKFPAAAGKWFTARLPLPALGKKYRLRFDPPGERGKCYVKRLVSTARRILKEPSFAEVHAAANRRSAAVLQSGNSVLKVSRDAADQFTLSRGNYIGLRGIEGCKIGYLKPGVPSVSWLNLQGLRPRIEASAARIQSTIKAVDEDGAHWTLTRKYQMRDDGSVAVTATCAVDKSRNVVYLPMFLTSGGAGGPLGNQINQALFCGLEYLDKNEPSSSEKDLIGEQARRRVPDSARITIPLMASVQHGYSSSFSWRPQKNLSALFDTPDRTFRSNGPAMGLIYPGSNGTTDRIEGNLLPYDGTLILPGQPVSAEVELLTEQAPDITTSVASYVKRHPLPAPPPKLPLVTYAVSASYGWLDSAISDAGAFKHAFAPWGDFVAGPAPDAALLIDWLSANVQNRTLSSKLQVRSKVAIEHTLLSDRALAGIGHIRHPSPCLNFGGVIESMRDTRAQALGEASRFEADGRLLYRVPKGRPDMGKTHFEPDANGLTAQAVYELLQKAAFAGDWSLIDKGIALLHALDRFHGSVPRGAQTWEVPLHTPDVLASANLVNAYVLGFRLTGDTSFRRNAEYWAWTGVPFVYLRRPTDGSIGPYATIPVLGATQWVSPNWMGLPVQWCGLVYAEALYALAQCGTTNDALWGRLADGITVSGTQQVYPQQDGKLYGLLPDSFTLRSQSRNLAAINPGTLQMCAIHLYRLNSVYSTEVLPQRAGIVHAPCAISCIKSSQGACTLEVVPWQAHPVTVLISGASSDIKVSINKKQASSAGRITADKGCLLIEVTGKTLLDISWSQIP